MTNPNAPWWNIYGYDFYDDDESKVIDVQANTRSEARGYAKKILGLKRMPGGTILVPYKKN